MQIGDTATASSSTPTAQSTRCAARVAAMIAAFGAEHVFDALPNLQGLNDGSADDLNDVAAGLVASGKIAALRPTRQTSTSERSSEMNEHNLATEAVAEAVKGAPPIAVAGAGQAGLIDWQTWVLVLTAIYLVMQMAYLAFKAWREFAVGDLDG
ncbi:hypothetical protein [Novosphingobium album (ex Liu et al. 2023)]|uniref:Uncharacterized protein n=1 Tax=Novosphingobium album (ex Liu et al. 2023) TaxID=3031130 RepID=A0ABT5WY11_9SPHN|nr:hypothetical protein [Novosphingobium album (ex Liu et al. 2023)]MDE8654764.1 hypothetical protein [Novosphingobium album (ex Liu et al. 2023)]